MVTKTKGKATSKAKPAEIDQKALLAQAAEIGVASFEKETVANKILDDANDRAENEKAYVFNLAVRFGEALQKATNGKGINEKDFAIYFDTMKNAKAEKLVAASAEAYQRKVDGKPRRGDHRLLDKDGEELSLKQALSKVNPGMIPVKNTIMAIAASIEIEEGVENVQAISTAVIPELEARKLKKPSKGGNKAGTKRKANAGKITSTPDKPIINAESFKRSGVEDSEQLGGFIVGMLQDVIDIKKGSEYLKMLESVVEALQEVTKPIADGEIEIVVRATKSDDEAADEVPFEDAA